MFSFIMFGRDFLQILKYGDTGALVALLQTGLNRAMGANLVADGIFGPATERALRAFQGAHGLVVDALAGPATQGALSPWYRGYVIHTISRGDTLWRIAGRYDTTLSALETANPGLDPFNLQIGQRLVVPLSFPVVPVDIPWSSALAEYCVQGLSARYPMMGWESIGYSVLARPLYALTLGEGVRRVLFTAAHHANEWITAPLLMKYTEELLRSYTVGERLGSYDPEELWSSCRITLVPTMNPDGVDLVTGALSPEERRGAEAIARRWPSIPYPQGWKANIEGVDLNLQYPALWETARQIKFSQGYTSPAPRDYVGTAPLTAPESRALAALTRRLDPALILAYHTQGEVIYWQFLDREPEGSRELGELLARLSGYALAEVPYESSFAGYKDWFIQEYDRPGYTVEAGLGENPLPLSQFGEIWADNVDLISATALG